MNELFYGILPRATHATLFFALYDDRTRLLRYANCGHSPALLLRRDETLALLGSTSTVVGLFEKWDCVIKDRQLSAGDTLLLYTDGVTEACDEAGEEFGEGRLVETMRECRDMSPPELLGFIAGRVRQFSPHEQADDITLIVSKCT